MADRITFTSAKLKSFTRKHSVGTAHFSASWNQKVAEAMNWEDVPECMTGGSLEGDLHATSCELTPSESALKKHGIDLDISRVYGFQAVRRELEGKKDKGHRTELRFNVDFADKAGAKKLEQYILTIGEGKASLAVSYTKQEILPGAEGTDDGQQPLLDQTRRKATSAESD